MRVEFFQTESGAAPVLTYLRSLDRKQRKMLGDSIRFIQDHDAFQKVKSIKDREPLREMKVGFHRLFFVIHDSTVHFLHAIQKEGDRTPHPDLEIAERRMKIVRGRR